jgi:hypothetical protein
LRQQILFAILGFDQDYIVMLYQFRNKRHLSPSLSCAQLLFQQWILCPHSALYQERSVFGKMKMDPAKRAQTQNAGEVSPLQWFFSQSVELMMDKVWLHCIIPMLLK